MRKKKRVSRCGVMLVGLITLAALLCGCGTSRSDAVSANAVPGSSSCTRTYQGPSFNGNIIVGPLQIACGSVVAFEGSIAIQGEVKGNVTAFNTAVVISGTIDGNLKLYGGSLVLQAGERVQGNTDLYGTQYMPQTVPAHGGYFHIHTNPIDWLYAFASGWDVTFWSLVIWEALGTFITLLFPEHLMFVRTTLVGQAKRGLLVGLLSVALAPLVLIILFALVITIPAAIIVGLGLVAAWALGIVAVGDQLGAYIIRKIAPQRKTRYMQVIVGLAVLVAAGALPIIGIFITIGAGMIGLGAVFLSRFGTRLYGRPRQMLRM
jgi:hypothetical protein